jgi:hypothetical protein
MAMLVKRFFLYPHIRLSFQTLVVAVFLSVCFIQLPIAHATTAPPVSNGPGKGIGYGQLFTGGKDRQGRNPIWARSKNLALTIIPDSQAQLNYAPAQSVSEPPYTGTDSAGWPYTDEYMWNLCGPGATTASLGYWSAVNRLKGKAVYTDPYATTIWGNSNYYSYVEYIATESYPPSYTSAGEMSWETYPDAYTAFNDVRDALNWEASGHSSSYMNYFYAVVGVSDTTLAAFEDNVQTDISTYGVPVIVSLNDSYLPDWPSTTNTSHFVNILGYDFNQETFTYDETCGTVSCDTDGTGVYTISIAQLWNGMTNDNGNGGYIW